MSTITLRIDENLQARVATAAERTGRTEHAFMLEAITHAVEQVELDDDFQRLADARLARLLSDGESVSFEDAKAYLTARVRGEQPARPVAHRLSHSQT
jgi:predicted transcriptional regulator